MKPLLTAVKPRLFLGFPLASHKQLLTNSPAALLHFPLMTCQPGRHGFLSSLSISASTRFSQIPRDLSKGLRVFHQLQAVESPSFWRFLEISRLFWHKNIMLCPWLREVPSGAPGGRATQARLIKCTTQAPLPAKAPSSQAPLLSKAPSLPKPLL